ncbi:hypothetical protein AXY1_30 [Achromobacter phage AXY1]|nr:hypothetical protein AXY1_30 [Achromobacter phage AXY1]
MTKRRLFYRHLSLRTRISIKLARFRSWLMARRYVGRFGFCPGCGQWRTDIERRRQLTQYVDEESNWNTHCQDCQAESDAYWEERWREYYSGLL